MEKFGNKLIKMEIQKTRFKSTGATKDQGTEIRVKPSKQIFGEAIAFDYDILEKKVKGIIIFELRN